jgi:hypothetical protein
MLARGGSDGRQPGFRPWWRGGAGNRPALGQARARLERHMPELVPVWQRLTAMINGPGADGDAGPSAVEPTSLPDRVLAGRGHGRRPGADPQLRLGLPAVRGGGGSHRYAGHRVLGMLDCL